MSRRARAKGVRHKCWREVAGLVFLQYSILSAEHCLAVCTARFQRARRQRSTTARKVRETVPKLFVTPSPPAKRNCSVELCLRDAGVTKRKCTPFPSFGTVSRALQTPIESHFYQHL